MADDSTREEVVTANLTAIKAKYGDEAWNRIFTQLLTDINVTLAKLLDSQPSE